MLFECPHCQHPSDVPEGELTGAPMVLECGSCHAKFRVVPEDTAEEAPVLEPPADERTAVGNTLPSALIAEEGGAIPSATDFEESDSRTLGEAEIEPRTMPIDTAEAELRRSVTTDANTLNVGRPPSSLEISQAEAEGAKTILQGPGADRSRTEKPARRVEARRAVRDEGGEQITVTPASKSNPDLYARIAHGEVISVVPVARPRERPSTKAWNEPSAVQVTPAGPSGLRTFITMLVAQLERAPLFLRVWLAVFPLALGLILLVSRPSPERAVPIAIPARATTPNERVRAVPEPSPVAPAPAPAPATGREPSAEDGDETDPESADGANLEVAPESPKSNAAEAPSLGFDDPEAAPGTAFVKIDGVKLRTSPGPKGKPITPVPAGTLVRQYEVIDDWTLVMVPPRGPAGFLKVSALDRRKPLAVLARELAFLGCTAAGSSVGGCIDDAERQLEACSSGCARVERCEQACRIAQETCVDGCKKQR